MTKMRALLLDQNQLWVHLKREVQDFQLFLAQHQDVCVGHQKDYESAHLFFLVNLPNRLPLPHLVDLSNNHESD